MLQFLPITPEDYPVLTQIMTAAFDEDTRLHTSLLHDGPRGYNDGTLIKKLHEIPGYLTEKVVLDGKVIGGYTVCYQQERSILDLLFLSPDVGGQGIGTQVWQHIEHHFADTRCWEVETPSYSKRNHYFYTKKCGFHFVREKQYSDDSSSFIFEKETLPVLDIAQMMKMQQELWQLHKDSWPPMEPERGRDFILWMMEEVGEVISVIKKKSSRDIMEDAAVRSHFVEECSDVLMYYFDTLLRYHITPQEISEAYLQKHLRNMGRDFEAEYRNKFKRSAVADSGLPEDKGSPRED